MNLANKLTLIRIILVPVFLIFLLVNKIPYGTIFATGVFIIASITDKLDGHIARSRNQITNFGKFMDPLADKLLVTSALISLVELKMIPAWAVIIIIAREFAVTGLRTIAASDGVVIAASWWGKLKTVIQMTAIIVLLLLVNVKSINYLNDLIVNSSIKNLIYSYIPWILIVAAVFITIMSGVDYFYKNKETISTQK